MPKYILISPLPEGISIAKVRQIFSPFLTQKIIVKDDQAYLKFADQNQVDSLYIKYDQQVIPELNNAKITALPNDFQASAIENEYNNKKQISVQDFINPQKKQSSNIKVASQNPIFLVISQCDQKLVDAISQQLLRKRIFNKYKIGRIIKYKKEVYIQFLDENQVQMLQVSFPNRIVKQLGPHATIDLTDQNFNFQYVKNEVQKYENEKRKKQQEQIERQERIKRQTAQLQQTKKRLSRELQAQKFNQFSNWSIRPEGQRQMQNINLNKKSGTQLFWALAIVMWGIYITFL